MKKNLNCEIKDLRSKFRIECNGNASVEFIPGKNEMIYHFKLKDFSSKGLGILVRNDSNVLKHIKPGDILMMRYHPEEATANPIPHKTKIMHISKPANGRYKGHMLVGLLILDNNEKEPG